MKDLFKEYSAFLLRSLVLLLAQGIRSYWHTEWNRKYRDKDMNTSKTEHPKHLLSKSIHTLISETKHSRKYSIYVKVAQLCLCTIIKPTNDSKTAHVGLMSCSLMIHGHEWGSYHVSLVSKSILSISHVLYSFSLSQSMGNYHTSPTTWCIVKQTLQLCQVHTWEINIQA